ncbi:MAG: hypothetical protein AABW89_01175 [Nanoarchaeota archaeon]
MKTSILYKGKRLLIEVKKTNFLTKGLGLTFRTKNTQNLIFDFSKPVTWQGNLTSIFVFFPFLALWLDNRNRVIAVKIVNPFTISISLKKPFYKIIEVPFNSKNEAILRNFIKKGHFNRYFRR